MSVTETPKRYHFLYDESAGLWICSAWGAAISGRVTLLLASDTGDPEDDPIFEAMQFEAMGAPAPPA